VKWLVLSFRGGPLLDASPRGIQARTWSVYSSKALPSLRALNRTDEGGPWVGETGFMSH
jgi:hypothetical protein